ncbi:MAG TPA: hypothetical protein QF533_08690 [Nitrospinota bacterium]|nr:hypothetical protein [Nitrospinota bacterium]HJP14400.1 hypothetical protein [Nitrospinota bacterium]
MAVYVVVRRLGDLVFTEFALIAEHNEGDARCDGVFSDLAEEVHPAHFGEAPLGDDEIDRGLGDCFKGFLAARRIVNGGGAHALEHGDEGVPQLTLVFDEKDTEVRRYHLLLLPFSPLPRRSRHETSPRTTQPINLLKVAGERSRRMAGPMLSGNRTFLKFQIHIATTLYRTKRSIY